MFLDFIWILSQTPLPLMVLWLELAVRRTCVEFGRQREALATPLRVIIRGALSVVCQIPSGTFYLYCVPSPTTAYFCFQRLTAPRFLCWPVLRLLEPVTVVGVSGPSELRLENDRWGQSW